MASTAAGARLTSEHRAAQLAIRSVALRQALKVWPALDPEHVFDSWPPVEAALLAIISQRGEESASVAGKYFRAFRMAEGISGSMAPVLSAVTGDAITRAETSLRITGPLTLERLTALRHPDPDRVALVRVSGAIARHVLAGGRQTLLASIGVDRRAMGYARTTGGNACAFCAMLVSRGNVYGERSGDFPAHDHCACSLEPVYRAR